MKRTKHMHPYINPLDGRVRCTCPLILALSDILNEKNSILRPQEWRDGECVPISWDYLYAGDSSFRLSTSLRERPEYSVFFLL